MKPTPSVTDALRANFSVAEHSYASVLSDTQNYPDKRVLYSFDFSLLHPYIFKSTHGKDPQYDAIGRSIFSILPIYINSCGFKPVLSTPSLLELLDSLEHRYTRISRLLTSNTSIDRIRTKLKKTIGQNGETYNENFSEISSFLSSLRFNDQQHESLDTFLSLLGNKKISLIRDHIDPSTLKELHKRHHTSFEDIYSRMSRDRSPNDHRNIDDKLFHYRVDSWNLTMSLISQDLNNVEIDHVCRGGVSKYMPTNYKREYTRHPLIPMIRLLSLLRASEDSNLEREANAFVRLGLRDTSEAMNLIKKDTVESLTIEEKSELNRVYDKYIRPMYYDYSQPNGAIDLKRAIEEIREMESSKYKPITTVDGMKEMFKANADDIKRSAQSIIDANPEMLSSRVLEDYDLEKSARVDEIKRQFGL